MTQIIGTQKETKKEAPKAVVQSKTEIADKLENGYRYVTIPAEDLYNYKFAGIGINQDNYGPGTHLVPSEVADSLEERLRVWVAYNTRLMRPQADAQALRQIGQIA